MFSLYLHLLALSPHFWEHVRLLSRTDPFICSPDSIHSCIYGNFTLAAVTCTLPLIHSPLLRSPLRSHQPSPFAAFPP